MTKATQYRDLSTLELQAALKENGGLIFHTINEKNQTKKAEKPHLLRKYKKERARMLTILHEKNIEQT